MRSFHHTVLTLPDEVCMAPFSIISAFPVADILHAVDRTRLGSSSIQPYSF